MKYDARACHFNMDTGCVELLLRDGRMISIDCTGVEDALDVTMAQQTELDYLIYNLSLIHIFHLPDYVCAPVQQGDVVGTVELKLAGETIGMVNLIAGQDVSRSSLLLSLIHI